MLPPHRKEVKLQVTLPGAGDSLTVLGRLYTGNTASKSALGSLQEMGRFPTKFRRRSVLIFAGLLQGMGPCFPASRLAVRVTSLFPNLPRISWQLIVVGGEMF